ncbi:DUF707 domain-containing protein [Alkalihalobacterium alkalinitrilicum]|uniref:DUF707 domain-containing protein n=1 Tax=Alkalihalobacterium alkalinitrilicum TaxID=427920 RepID=UPI0009950F7D|nr:DUF707 domain-containing protein [Alkalihalobacterium alkalinitrilicum]
MKKNASESNSMLENNEGRIIKPFNYSGKKRFLVMARVGDTSLHKEWLHPDRKFDLFLEYFGDGSNNYKEDCDFYSEAKNSKWPRFHKIIEDFGDHIFKYDAVWMPDDDISTDCSTIHQLFDLFTKYKLSLAQPSLSKDSYYSHDITRQVPRSILRYTNFVEVMVPLFSREALQLCWDTFKKSKSGWGLDSVWPKLLGNPRNKIAIIDEVSVKHTRPLRKGTLYDDIHYTLSDSKIELHCICKEYGVKEPFNFKINRTLPKKKR